MNQAKWFHFSILFNPLFNIVKMVLFNTIFKILKIVIFCGLTIYLFLKV